MTSRKLLSLAAIGAIIAACGGGVSLGNAGTDGGTDPGDGGGSSRGSDSSPRECSSKSACGPAPAAPAIACSDGSIGGNTGRCIEAADKSCVWEIRPCPPAAACFDGAGALDPSFKRCSTTQDCVVLEYDLDCCGTKRAAGVASAGRVTVQQCAQDCAAALPKCGCAASPTRADDGSTAEAVTVQSPAVTCTAARLCETSFKGTACGKHTCNADESCCSGVPFTEPTCVGGGACPISRRAYKKNISYLVDADRQRLNDELMSFRLATYRYASESAAEREHLGFIIDDVAPSAAVMANGERVDMYGYQSMAVAALQVQAREIAELRQAVEMLERACERPARAR